jgi:hypothetical protein
VSAMYVYSHHFSDDQAETEEQARAIPRYRRCSPRWRRVVSECNRQSLSSRPPVPAGMLLRTNVRLGLVAGPQYKPTPKEKNLVSTINSSLTAMKDATRFMKTEGQRELLAVMLEMLATFFPTGYGVINVAGERIRKSDVHAIEAKITQPGGQTFMPFRYEVQLFLSHQPSEFATGSHSQLREVRSLINLYVDGVAGRSANELGSVLVHEMVHMMVALRASVEARAGRNWGRIFPTSKTAPLLNLSTFAGSRQALEKHFSTLLAYLEREHGILNRSADPNRTPASLIAEMAVEEVLANLFRMQVSIAIAEVEFERAKAKRKPGGTPAAISTGFLPMSFLKNYLRHHWIRGLKGTSALTTAKAQQILKEMEPDVLKLVGDVESQMAA